MAEPLSILKNRDAFYTFELTLNEVDNKVSRQIAKQHIEELRPYFERLAETTSEAERKRLISQIDRTAKRQDQEFDDKVQKRLSKFVYGALQELNAVKTGVEEPKRPRTDAEQERAVKRTPTITGSAKPQTPRGMNRDLLNTLKEQAGRVFKSPGEMEMALNKMVSDKTAVNNTVLDDTVRKAKLQAGKEVSNEYMYLTMGDDRVTDICSPHHGKVFKYGAKGAPVPPLHYNCRCTIEPITSDTAGTSKRLRRPGDIDRWFQSKKDVITRDALESKVYDKFPKTRPKRKGKDGREYIRMPGRKSKIYVDSKEGQRLLRTQAQRRVDVLNSVKKKAVWASNESFLTTKGEFNDAAARRLLTKRLKKVGIPIKLPPTIRGSRAPAQRLNKDTVEAVYGPVAD